MNQFLLLWLYPLRTLIIPYPFVRSLVTVSLVSPAYERVRQAMMSKNKRRSNLVSLGGNGEGGSSAQPKRKQRKQVEDSIEQKGDCSSLHGPLVNADELVEVSRRLHNRLKGAHLLVATKCISNPKFNFSFETSRAG